MGKRIDGVTVSGLRVDRAGGSLIELRADGSATLSAVDAVGVLDPAVLTCGAFLLDWKGSNSGFNSSSAYGCGASTVHAPVSMPASCAVTTIRDA
jgi:hypothetical protein